MSIVTPSLLAACDERDAFDAELVSLVLERGEAMNRRYSGAFSEAAGSRCTDERYKALRESINDNGHLDILQEVIDVLIGMTQFSAA